ncbi:N-acetyltransferase family protein [[Eubacterium] cellulosolvens]
MKLLAEQGNISYIQLENPMDIDRYKLQEFEFFRQMGIIDYKETFKAWLRKFPKPIFIIAMSNDSIIGWIHIDEWGEGVARDGNPVYVLRAIETVPNLRKRKIGYRLVLLGLRVTVGYMVVKPINQRAEAFFRRIGFEEKNQFKNPPMDLSKHPTYLILSMPTKQDLLKNLNSYFNEVHYYRTFE